MYEVHPDGSGKWVLCEAGAGDVVLVAWFADEADAEFAREAFQARKTGSPATAGSSGGCAIVEVTMPISARLERAEQKIRKALELLQQD